MKRRNEREGTNLSSQPRTLSEAVNRLSEDLPLQDKVALAYMREDELDCVNFALSEFMRNCYGFGTETELMESCRSKSGTNDLSAYEATALIVRELWTRLRDTHRLRAIKEGTAGNGFGRTRQRS